MKALTRLVPALVLIIGGVTVISAAPESTPPADPAAKVTVTASGTLSAAEMSTRAKLIEVQVADDYRFVLSLKDRTKKQQDVVKLNCVNDKLVQIKAQMNIAQTTTESLNGAIERNSDDRASIFVELSGTSESVKKLREEASACLGEPELFKQESGVDVHKPEIPDDPTTIDPYDNGGGGVSVEPPGYASPFH